MAAIEELETTYNLIDRNFEKLMEQATSESQRKQLKQDYVVARDAYFVALARALDENDPVVKDLAADLTRVRQDIVQKLQDLQNVVAIFGLLTSAVRLAASIVTVGVA